MTKSFVIYRIHKKTYIIGLTSYKLFCEYKINKEGIVVNTGGLYLTKSQREVAALVATGLSNKEIARSLHLAEKTVRNHLSNIFARNKLRSRVDLAVIWTRQQLEAQS